MRLRLQPINAITALIGILFIAFGIHGYGEMGEELARMREAPAVVVEVASESVTRHKGRMHPVVRFTTEDGREVVARSERHRALAPGAAVTVLYDSANPERIELGTLARSERQQILLCGAAVVFGIALILGALAADLGLVRALRSDR